MTPLFVVAAALVASKLLDALELLELLLKLEVVAEGAVAEGAVAGEAGGAENDGSAGRAGCG